MSYGCDCKRKPENKINFSKASESICWELCLSKYADQERKVSCDDILQLFEQQYPTSSCSLKDWNRSHLLISDVTVSKSLCFHLSTLRRSVFKTPSPLLNLFSEGTVVINVSEYFSVDNWQKRIKKYTFSNQTAVVQKGAWGKRFSAFLRR